MIVNFVNEGTPLLRNEFSYNICIYMSCICSLYFILNVLPTFSDITLGIMYATDIYDYSGCLYSSEQLIDIKKWLLINGIFGYLGLLSIVLLKKVYTQETFGKKLIKISTYVINIFISIWTLLGMISFFKYNYSSYNKEEKECLFIYNYVLIRLILAPLICISKFMEIYI